MGIFDRFHKKSGEGGYEKRNSHIAALVARLEGPDKENPARIVREDAEKLGDSILEVQLTSLGSAATWSSDENVTNFVKKYNDLLTQCKK